MRPHAVCSLHMRLQRQCYAQVAGCINKVNDNLRWLYELVRQEEDAAGNASDVDSDNESSGDECCSEDSDGSD